jgi:hypothetical protein
MVGNKSLRHQVPKPPRQPVLPLTAPAHNSPGFPRFIEGINVNLHSQFSILFINDIGSFDFHFPLPTLQLYARFSLCTTPNHLFHLAPSALLRFQYGG